MALSNTLSVDSFSVEKSAGAYNLMAQFTPLYSKFQSLNMQVYHICI